jgi:hypothetical protein
MYRIYIEPLPTFLLYFIFIIIFVYTLGLKHFMKDTNTVYVANMDSDTVSVITGLSNDTSIRKKQ